MNEPDPSSRSLPGPGDSSSVGSGSPSTVTPATPALDYAGPSAPRWTVGTLTYTRAGLFTLYFWLLLGDFAWSTRERSVGPMSSWYLKQLGVSNVVFALIMSSLPSAMSLIISPIVSFKSDRHRGPNGRRIPFIRATTIGAGIGMAGLALSGPAGNLVHGLLGAASPGATACGVAFFAVFWLVYEFATISAQSVFHALINDVVPHALVGRFFGLFRIVSLTDGIIFNQFLLGKVEKHFVVMMLCVTAIYTIFMLVMCRFVREGQYPPPAPVAAADEQAATRFAASVKGYFRDCFSNPFFLLVFFFGSTAGLAYNPIGAFAIPHGQHLSVSMGQMGQLWVIMFFCSFTLAYPVGWLADRFHPIRVMIVSLSLHVLVAAWGTFNADTVHGFQIGLVASGVLSGVHNTAIAAYSQRMLPRLRFAQFSSANALVWHCLALTTSPLIGLVIDFRSNDYRWAYGIACGISLTAIVIGLTLLRRFNALGGDRDYVPPFANP